jgi:hypothetical protein
MDVLEKQGVVSVRYELYVGLPCFVSHDGPGEDVGVLRLYLSEDRFEQEVLQ